VRYYISDLNFRKPFTRANALLNAVKREYGVHCHLLPLDLPTSPPPPTISVPPRLPRLPATDLDDRPLASLTPLLNNPEVADGVREIRMDENDIKETGKFVREFAVQSLIPWMERNVLEWNEAVGQQPLLDAWHLRIR
jgi:trafficking protein particle complex subunit 8